MSIDRSMNQEVTGSEKVHPRRKARTRRQGQQGSLVTALVPLPLTRERQRRGRGRRSETGERGGHASPSPRRARNLEAALEGDAQAGGSRAPGVWVRLRCGQPHGQARSSGSPTALPPPKPRICPVPKQAHPTPQVLPVHPGHSLPDSCRLILKGPLLPSQPSPPSPFRPVFPDHLLKGWSPIAPLPQASVAPQWSRMWLRTWIPPSPLPQCTHRKPWGAATSVPSTHCAVSTIHVLIQVVPHT